MKLVASSPTLGFSSLHINQKAKTLTVLYPSEPLNEVVIDKTRYSYDVSEKMHTALFFIHELASNLWLKPEDKKLVQTSKEQLLGLLKVTAAYLLEENKIEAETRTKIKALEVLPSLKINREIPKEEISFQYA